ncbi:hypothetical protein OUZ56_013856 [Daphnia magna]|uniref:Secreted protein n=1 Tax=Daphnia magna TaxID=35525 RepID=A0ABQ9Z747_9CRUS|nr:hypothetical protein OUZ56_013856 [Daphnia magna]
MIYINPVLSFFFFFFCSWPLSYSLCTSPGLNSVPGRAVGVLSLREHARSHPPALKKKRGNAEN